MTPIFRIVTRRTDRKRWVANTGFKAIGAPRLPSVSSKALGSWQAPCMERMTLQKINDSTSAVGQAIGLPFLFGTGFHVGPAPGTCHTSGGPARSHHRHLSPEPPMRSYSLTLAGLCCVALLSVEAVEAADFRVYGRLHAGYAQLDSGQGGSTSLVNDERSNSRLGVNVQHPLGDNIGGLGRIELGFDPTNWDNDEDPINMREAWVGIQGNIGRLTLGRIGSAYKTTGGTGWDPMNATLLQQRRTGGASGGPFGHNSYVDRAVEYLSPTFAGLQLRVQLGLDKRNDEGNDGNYTVGLSYQEGPWELIAAWARDDSDDTPSGESRNWKTGIRYATSEGALFYRYEDVKIRDRLDLAAPAGDDGLPDAAGYDIADLTAYDLGFNTRHHLVGLQQNYASSTLWLAIGHMNASEDDFDVTSYTASWTWLLSDALNWYIGYQHQDRDSGYQTGRLNLVASGFNLTF